MRYQDEVYSLEAGMILGADALVDTNNSFVEIADSYENIYRLAPESQFCLEMTVKGVIPVHLDMFMLFLLIRQLKQELNIEQVVLQLVVKLLLKWLRII